MSFRGTDDLYTEDSSNSDLWIMLNSAAERLGMQSRLGKNPDTGEVLQMIGLVCGELAKRADKEAEKP